MVQALVDDAIPAYTIDLSRPAEARYDEIARDFGPRMSALIEVLDEVLVYYLPNRVIRGLVRHATRWLMRRVFDDEEMRELRGISNLTGIDIHFLVALNNLLDWLLACTSGAALVTPSAALEGDHDHTVSEEPRLMHFRTLDWRMDPLRNLLVVLEFVDRRSSGDTVIARSVTYAGFVGMITAVRENLSLSLNFRPNQKPSRSLQWHQFQVVLGYRRSIGSTLRGIILNTNSYSSSIPWNELDFREQAEQLSTIRTAPCYLVLCSGTDVAIIQKDFNHGIIKIDTDFVVQTNHDMGRDLPLDKSTSTSTPNHEEWLQDSLDRKYRVEMKWKNHLENSQALLSAVPAAELPDGAANQNRQAFAERLPVSEVTLKEWILTQTTQGGYTHFACLLDPKTAQIRWVERGPVGAPELRQEG